MCEHPVNRLSHFPAPIPYNIAIIHSTDPLAIITEYTWLLLF